MEYEAAKFITFGERIAYINVMNRLSVDCDCDGNPAGPDMPAMKKERLERF